MPKKKTKKVKISTLKKKLWKLCSEYVRKRDKGICITCSKYGEGSAYHAGHLIPSSICGVDLRYDEFNVHGQCYNCNINLGGYGGRYEQVMRQRYGDEFVNELWKRKETGKQWKEADYLKKIEYYKQKLYAQGKENI